MRYGMSSIIVQNDSIRTKHASHCANSIHPADQQEFTFMCNASLGVVPARFDNARPLRSASTTTTRQKGNIQPVDFFT
jgi:hypothetical protein